MVADFFLLKYKLNKDKKYRRVVFKVGKSVFHIFKNEGELRNFIVKADPMKEFKSVKKEVIFKKVEKKCEECSTPFILKHPAEHFCEKCSKKVNKKNKRTSVVENMKINPSIKNCIQCDAEFYRTAPRMRKCKNCSPKGGELVTK